MMTNGNSRSIFAWLFYLTPALLLIVLVGWVVWFTQFSYNALFTAAHEGSAERVKMILARGVSVDARDPLGKSTALMMAAHSPGSVEACRALLDSGADVNASNVFGNTALMLAASSGCTDVVRFLISRGANVNATNHRGRTALYMAQREGHRDVVALLVRAGAK